MKKYLIKPISVLAAAVMLASMTAAPLNAIAQTAEPTSVEAPALRAPEGYNAHDYEKAAAFLEQAGSNGVKNGAKLSAGYDMLDPETWGTNAQNLPRFEWSEVDGELRLTAINCSNIAGGGLTGALDVSGCTALEVLNVNVNALTALNASGCTALYSINCTSNSIASFDVSGCETLRFLECRWNLIPNLDLSSCPNLTVLICTDNRMKTLDLTANPLLGGVGFLRMRDSGNKYVSCFISMDPEYQGAHEYFISADCTESCTTYNGWYTEDGRFITNMPVFTPTSEDGSRFVARFADIYISPGDVDIDGVITLADALRIQRIAMGILPLPNNSSADVNGDGVVNMTDAMLIMRRVMAGN